METSGALWGARRDVMMRASAAVNEFLESVTSLGIVKGKAQVDVTFDEFSVDVEIRYDGELMELPERAADGRGVRRRRSNGGRQPLGLFHSPVCRQRHRRGEDGQCRVRLHFDH